MALSTYRVPESGTAPDFLDIVERVGGTGYWHVDLATGSIFYSDEVARIHEMPPGYRPESVDECVEWYHPEDRAKVVDAVETASRAGRPFAYEARLVSASNAIRWVSGSGEIRRDDTGTPSTILGTLKDVTETRALHQKMCDALSDAKCANRLKDTFLANMSHELRTPLNAIIGFSQLIKMMEEQGKVQEQVGDYAQDIMNAGSHLLAIIEDIFNLAQMEAEADKMSLGSLEVGALLDDVRSLTGTTARQYERSVTFDTRECDGVNIVADRDKMTKIMVNLISNAVKFSPPDAPIEVAGQIGSCGRVLLRVTDQGPGIPEHLHEKIFERFERLEASKHAIEGIGVGLAIARDLVESMGGEIGVDSVEGEGASFWLAFDIEEPVPNAVAI